MFDDLKAARVSILLLLVSGVFVYGLFLSSREDQIDDVVDVTGDITTVVNTGDASVLDEMPLGSGLIVEGDELTGMIDMSGSVRDVVLSGSLDDVRGLLDETSIDTSTGSVGSGLDMQRTGSVLLSGDGVSVAERTLLKEQGIPLLSGSEPYFEEVASFDRIGVVPRMTFKRSVDEIYFGLLSTGSYDRPRIARSLQGNALAFVTEKDILTHNLPGTAVTFINLPEYKEKLVIMVVDTGQYKRIVQLPKKNYHQSKDKLKNILGSAE